MKKVVVGITVFIFLLASVGMVSAHFLATDNNIGAILHVDPNDSPIAGSQASFFFEFHDKQNKFEPKNCTCTFTILEDSKEVYSQPLFQNNSAPSLENASVFYTFPQIGVYTIQVVGTPNSEGQFQPFKLSWVFRIDTTAASQNQSPNKSLLSAQIIPIASIIIVVLFCVIYAIIMVKKKGIKKHEL